MKAVAHFDIDLSRLREVRSAESVGVVQQEPRVCHIDGLQRHYPIFPEPFANGNVEPRMAWQVIRTIAIQKPRTIVDISRNKTARWKINRKARTQRVALIVIEEEEIFPWREIRQSTRDRASSLRALV